MRVQFWGTRGSIAKAGPSTVRYGGNTSCVELRSAAGTLVVLDCGTGAYGLGNALIEADEPCRGGHILITHTHWDHIQGIPFFAPLFVPGSEWHIYGPRGLGPSLRETLAGQMQYTYFPITAEQFAATVDYHDLVEGSFDLADIHVTTQYLNHPALSLGYRLEADGVNVVYATDHEPHSSRLAAGAQASSRREDERHTRFVQDADLLIHDAQYTAEEYPQRIGWGHSTLEYVVDTAISAGVRRLALFHHDPLRDDDAVDGFVEMARQRVTASGRSLEVLAAAEGLILEPTRDTDQASPVVPATNVSATATPSLAIGDSGVLIAVSDSVCAGALSEAVSADELRLFTARDRAEVTRIVRSECPSLVILEQDMLACDAFEACREIRAEQGAYGDDVPIVVVVEQERNADMTKGAAVGVTDWLVKPFSGFYARTRVRAWLLRVACRWMRAPLPVGEPDRIAALQRLDILDSEPEERFDRFTRIAAGLFDTPVALVSLVDTDRQWFKSRHGLDASETPRDMAFCAHAILDDEVLLVPDALEDQRFADNPLVTDDPRVRFYAGVPLSLDDGNRVGTLCVIDHRPRNLDETEVGLLRDLGNLVERELQTGPR